MNKELTSFFLQVIIEIIRNRIVAETDGKDVFLHSAKGDRFERCRLYGIEELIYL
jgi:hypothetical protein